MSSVGKMKYYSGMVMRGINKNLGRPILSGGRYDGLCDSFGKHVPAVGFAIGIGYLVTALDNQDKLQKMPEIEVVVGYAPEFMDKAEKYVDKLRAKGVNAICSFATDKATLKKSKKAIGANRAVYLSKDGEEEI